MMTSPPRLCLTVLFLYAFTICYARELPGWPTFQYNQPQQGAAAGFQGGKGQALARTDGNSAFSSSWSSSNGQSFQGTAHSQLDDLHTGQAAGRNNPASSSINSTPQQLGQENAPVSNQWSQLGSGSEPPWQGTDQGSAPLTQSPQDNPDGASADDLQAVLDQHNGMRTRHGVPPLTWSNTLSSGAQEWADRCVFEHSQSGDGENLAMGHACFQQAVLDWYNEVQAYDWNNPGFSEATGHFTQIVWKDTTQLGSGYSNSCNQKLYVCRYSPAGNVEGDFEQNVFPLVSNTKL